MKFKPDITTQRKSYNLT